MRGEHIAMYAIKPYQRLHAVEYAKKWALDRNPLFRDFAGCGGDCTNFISQSIFAGSCIMNDTPTFGWYFRSPEDYAPAWTGVPYLYNFLTTNMGNGPVGVEVDASRAELGDLIQLGRRDGTYYHTVIITGKRNDDFLVSAHNNDALDRPLSSYTYDNARFIHITGVRFTISAGDCCYNGVIDGTSVFPNTLQAQALTCYPPEPQPMEETQPQPSSTEQMPAEEARPERPADLMPQSQIPPANSTSDLSPDDL